MTGPEHYAEAQAILDEVHGDETTDKVIACAALAQVHATLALAAATALNDNDGGLQPTEWHAWNDLAGTSRDMS